MILFQVKGSYRRFEGQVVNFFVALTIELLDTYVNRKFECL